jgi:glycosyltransferase involved in cell wall biosynthesis
VNRVVYVLRAFPEPSETFIRDEIRALRGLGVPVSILAGSKSKTPAADWTAEDGAATAVTFFTHRGLMRPARWARWVVNGCRLGIAAQRDLIRTAPWRLFRISALQQRAAALASELPSDAAVLHAHFANDAAVLARYISRLSGIPYRVTAHAYDIYQDPLLLVPNLREASRILTISEANRRYLADLLGGQPGSAPRIELVRCGIDLERFAYRDPRPPGTPARLFCAARLVPKKGHAVLLEALARLRRDGLQAELTLAGDGPEERRLRARASQADLDGAVTFQGTIPHDEVRAGMLRAEAVVLASRVAADGDRDGIPVALMEAMALGVPVVSTAVSGIPELVTDGAGRLVPADAPEALAEAIRATLAAPQASRVSQARAGRARVEAEFDLRRNAGRLAP